MISLQSLFLSAITAFLTRYADGSPNGLVNKGITVLFSIIPKSNILFLIERFTFPPEVNLSLKLESATLYVETSHLENLLYFIGLFEDNNSGNKTNAVP